MQIKNIPAAWVAFADVYGFKQLLKSRVQDLPGLMASLEAAYASAKPRLQATTELFTLSDNVFLLVPCAQGGSWQRMRRSSLTYESSQMPSLSRTTTSPGRRVGSRTFST